MSDIASNQPADGKSRRHIPPWSWTILVSVLAWAVILIAIPPSRQDFPLGDDWAFSRSAIWFAHGQGIHYSKWASMPQLGQWLWSCPFLLVFGSSHFVLRVSTMVLSWLGMIAFYDLLRQEKVPSRLAGFAACAIAVNPLFFISQGTYQTDVPALSFGLMALNFYSRAINRKNLRWLSGAVVLAVLGASTRQTMIAVPLVAGLMLLRFSEIRLKPPWLLSVVVPVALCLGTNQWFARRPDIMPMHLFFGWQVLWFRPFIALHWCGLVVLPLCLLTWPRRNWRIFFGAFVFMLLVAGCVFHWGKNLPYGGIFPYCGGLSSPWGTYSDGLVVGHREILLTQPIRMAISFLGCIGGAEILTALFETVRARKFPGLLLMFTLIQFLFTLTLPTFMDRYLEVLFPGAVCLVVAHCSVSNSGWRRLSGAAVLAMCGLISVALLHDWLSWNTARWELGRQAIATKTIQPTDIEGGFEWNGWYASTDPDHPQAAPEANHAFNHEAGLSLPFSRYFFPQVKGQFALAFSQPENSVVVASLPYTLWLSATQKDFLFVQYQERAEKNRP